MSDPASQTRCRQSVTVDNRKGLHARASAKFVRVASMFNADVMVTKGDITVSGASIMGLMMLAAAAGDVITIEARGREASDAVAALVHLFQNKFDED